MSTALAIQPTAEAKLREAKTIYHQIAEIEGERRRSDMMLLRYGWRLGQLLTEIKEDVGHGNFLLFLDGKWPDLGERKAQLCMQFYRSNPRNSSEIKSNSQPFTTDSQRKFMWNYIPAKERPALEGDGSVSAKPHYLSFVNHFVKWDRQLSLGHVEMPSVAQFRKEMETPLRRIIEIGGKEWAQSLII